MSCFGCGKPLKRDRVCKACSNKPWHEVDKALEKFAVIYFKREQRLLKHVLSEKYYPAIWYGSEFSDGEEIEEEDRLNYIENTPVSVNDVTFAQAFYFKSHFFDEQIRKKERLKSLNDNREESESCPKSKDIKRRCRVCKTRKPLNSDNFYPRMFCWAYNEPPEGFNDYLKKMLLGHVCRDCFEIQKEAMKELKRLKVNIGGFKTIINHNHQEKLLLLAMARKLIELKKRRKEYESSHKNVYGKQRAAQKYNEGTCQP